jgi:hypothetical protein
MVINMEPLYRDQATCWKTEFQLPLGDIMDFFFIFATASRLDLGPTQPPIEWAPRDETDHSLPSSAEM